MSEASEAAEELAKILKKLDALAPGASQVVMEIPLLRALLAERTEWEALLRHAVKECDRLTDSRYGDNPFLIAYDLMERIQKALPPPPEPKT